MYSYEHCYYHLEKKTTWIREKQLWFGKNNFVLMRLTLKFKLANDNSFVTIWLLIGIYRRCFSFMFKCSVYKPEKGIVNLKYINSQEKFT